MTAARLVFGIDRADGRPEPPPPDPEPYAGAGRLGALPLVEACPDPTATRARQRRADAAGRGNVSPCYRCLAYRPATRTGCHFTERMDTR